LSPTVLRLGAYRFFFYSREESRPHIHVEEGNNTAKFWINPVELAESYGFSTTKLNKIERLVKQNEDLILKEWRDFHA